MISMNRRTVLTAAGATTIGVGLASGAAAKQKKQPSLLVDINRQPDFEIDLWPDGAPGGEGVALNEHFVERDNPRGLPDRTINDITRPRLTAFRPAHPDGSAILIIPGGGYNYIVVEKEGWESAQYFSSKGAMAYVLTYRLPQQGWAAGPDTPLQDAQRAMRIIRTRINEDKIDPARIAAMGFSAGGHVAGSLLTRHSASVYDAVDAADALSARPDVGALIYPVATMNAQYAHMGSRTNLIGADPSETLVKKYSIEIAPPADTPPTWFLQASDDGSVPVENTLMTYKAFKDVGVPVAMHIFEKGGHGFGLRGVDDTPLRDWPHLFLRWGEAHAIFKRA